jgi:hypothetical protein
MRHLWSWGVVAVVQNVLFLGDKFTLMMEGSMSAWDPIREVAYMTWLPVVSVGANVISEAVH